MLTPKGIGYSEYNGQPRVKTEFIVCMCLKEDSLSLCVCVCVCVCGSSDRVPGSMHSHPVEWRQLSWVGGLQGGGQLISS